MAEVEIIPALIPKDLKEIQTKLELVKSLVKKVQIDFIDGSYAPPKTWPFNLKEQSNQKIELPFKNEIILEADLLIKHPEDFIADFVAIGIKSFVFHINSTHYLNTCIHRVKEVGLEVGLGIKPNLASNLLTPFLEKIDFVQFMGNDRVGYNGVELDRRVLKKIADFNAEYPFMKTQIDIGVTMKTAPELIQAGINALVSGSAVFEGGKIEENIEKLKQN